MNRALGFARVFENQKMRDALLSRERKQVRGKKQIQSI